MVGDAPAANLNQVCLEMLVKVSQCVAGYSSAPFQQPMHSDLVQQNQLLQIKNSQLDLTNVNM